MTTLYDILLGLPLDRAVDEALSLPDRAVLASNLKQFRTLFSLLDEPQSSGIQEYMKDRPFTVKELPYQKQLDDLVLRKQQLGDKFDLPLELSILSNLPVELVRSYMNFIFALYS